jgi:hypothetical protein
MTDAATTPAPASGTEYMRLVSEITSLEKELAAAWKLPHVAMLAGFVAVGSFCLGWLI